MRYATSFLSFFPSLRLYLLYVIRVFIRVRARSTFFSFLSFSKSFFSFSRARQFTITREKNIKDRFERMCPRKGVRIKRRAICMHCAVASTASLQLQAMQTHHRKTLYVTLSITASYLYHRNAHT